MTQPDRIVVVGGGAAAHTCVDAYREAEGSGELTVLSADDRLPYFRPYLTKELLAGDVEEDSIGLDDASWYSDRNAEVRLDTRATAVDLANRTVATDHGPVPYDQLVLATGSSASTLPVPGADSSRLSMIRSAADALGVIEAVCDGDPVVVVGSGFIGCEVASSLRQRGLEVTMVSMEPLPQQDRLSPVVGELIGSWLRDAGVTLRGGLTVEAVEALSGSILLRLSDGTTAEAAHVIVASGARPNVELAADAGLPIDGGVVVDSSMRTPVAGVFAVGDIAFALNRSAGRHLRIEHWGDAEQMGRIAGTVMAGHQSDWTDVPGFWSTITGRELKYVAWGDGWDQVGTRPSSSGLTVWYGHDGITVGVLTFDHDEDLELGTALIRSGSPFPPPKPVHG